MKASGRFLERQIKFFTAPMGAGVEDNRRAQRRVGALACRLTRNVRREPLKGVDFTASWAIPDGADDGRVMLYLHGGGYVAGDESYSNGFGGVLAETCGIRTLCVAYRLAPEHRFPAALDDCMAAYRFLLEHYTANSIALIGESAGGGLCYALALRARDEGLAMPVCMVTMSPWLNLRNEYDSFRLNAETDPSLCRETLDFFADCYAPDDKGDPYASPLLGELHSLPDSFIVSGTHEVLEFDSIFMAEKLRAAGSNCRLHLEDGGWHVYPFYGLPESRRALQMIRTFMEEKLSNDG